MRPHHNGPYQLLSILNDKAKYPLAPEYKLWGTVNLITMELIKIDMSILLFMSSFPKGTDVYFEL